MSWLSSVISDIGGEISHIASSVGGEISHIASSVGGEVGTVYAHVIRPALPIIATGISTVVAPFATPYLLSADIGIYGHGALTGGIQGVINPTLGSYEAGALTAGLYGAGQLYTGITAAPTAVNTATAGQAVTGNSTQLLENLSNASYNPLTVITGNSTQLLENLATTPNALDTLGNAASSVYNTFAGVGKGVIGLAGIAETGLGAINEFRGTVGQPAINILGQIQPSTTQAKANGLPGAAQTSESQQGGSSSSLLGGAGGGVGLNQTTNNGWLEIAAIAAIGAAALSS